MVGSISGSMLLGKLKGIDIRTMGSGNAGGTNALRTAGPLFALGVIIIDIAKGIIAVTLISQIAYINLYPLNASLQLHQIMCGAAAVVGHVYPLFYNFKGGKGAGTLIGIVLMLCPGCLPYAILSWLIVIMFTGYVGLGTIIAGVMLVVSAYILEIHLAYLYFVSTMASFIIFTHRSNIIRMYKGTENQFKKVMLFKKFNK